MSEQGDTGPWELPIDPPETTHTAGVEASFDPRPFGALLEEFWRRAH